MPSSLFRLHPHLQHGIVNDLGWRELRPVQELAVDAVLDGCNAVVLAPTAGGKTEASLFPVLSRILSEDLKPVAALYICPIRALLNNQEGRIAGLTRMVGLEAFKWHGDVGDSQRKRFRDRPAHVLMTTPESLEVMLISARTDARTLFPALEMVIVDEVHAFAGDDRGAHLAAILERISRFCGRDVQRIGLSATVGNPRLIGEWLQGSSKRPFRLVDPPREKVTQQLTVERVESAEEAAMGAARLARDHKSLVFVESRSQAERVGHALNGSGIEVFIHHSAVSRADRELAEAQFTSGSNTAIVCTSTMELGLDVGDLHQIIQIDAPSTVASFLQRIGRTGRRAGATQRCTFFCLSSESLLQTLALVRLAGRGWVEDVRPPAQAMHVLAHQVMALCLQETGLSRHLILEWLQAAYPFAGIRDERVQELVGTMLEREILYESEGLLSLGQRGEALYGRRHFFELYAVFSSPRVLKVVAGKNEIGYLQANFALMQDRREGPLCFRLAGRAWQAVHIDWGRGVVAVEPADHGVVPSWIGQPGYLSREVCQAMRDVLIDEGAGSESLIGGAREDLHELRRGYLGLLEPGTAPLERQDDGVQWHTFAGGAVNRLLAEALGAISGVSWIAGNLSLRAARLGLAEAGKAIAGLLEIDWEATAAAAARSIARGPVSKFQPCLPAAAEDRLLAERLLDVPGTLRFLATTRVNGLRLGGAPAGTRVTERELRLPATIEVSWPRVSDVAVPSNPIVWVDEPGALEQACEVLRGESVIGLDVETALDFGSLYLVQVASPTRTYLVDPLALDSLTPLAALFEASVPLKVIHNAAFERRILAGVGVGLEGVFDTLHASRRYRVDVVGGHSLAAVCQRELGLRLDKSEQRSNWARRPLSESQIVYAALDAEVLLRLRQCLVER